MLAKIKALPEKKAFIFGLLIILISPLFLSLCGMLISINNLINWLIQGIIWGFAFFFILSAANKRHSRTK